MTDSTCSPPVILFGIPCVRSIACTDLFVSLRLAQLAFIMGILLVATLELYLNHQDYLSVAFLKNVDIFHGL